MVRDHGARSAMPVTVAMRAYVGSKPWQRGALGVG
jgi:hypothetical protein